MKSLLLIASICFSLNSYSSPLFESDVPFEITIKGKFFSGDYSYKKFWLDKSKKYSEGQISYTHEGEEYDHTIEFKSRGGTRHSMCDIPPYKLKIFEKEGSPFAGTAKTLKLVTHCKHFNEGIIQNTIENQKVISEYVAYRLMAKIYPYSFKVRLIKVKYVDNKYGLISKGYGLILEHKKSMAKRYGIKVFKGELPEKKEEYFTDDFPMDNYVQISLANSMINNIDWGPFVNVVLVKDRNQENILVPYDFDQTGVVQDYGNFVEGFKMYDESHDYFNPARFDQYWSFRYLQNNLTKKYQLNLNEIKDLYTKHAEDFHLKKEEVLSEFEKYKQILEPENYKLIKKRLNNFFTALNKSFDFYTREDYVEHLNSDDVEAKANAIRFLSLNSTDRDGDFKLLSPLFFKVENAPLKKLLNYLIIRERRFGPDYATKFLSMVSKPKKKNLFRKSLIALLFMQKN